MAKNANPLKAPIIAEAARPASGFGPTAAALRIITGRETPEETILRDPVALAIARLAAQIAAAHAKLADDIYNAAVIQQPDIFAAMRGPDATLTNANVDDSQPFTNTLDVPVVMVTRADNLPADDVTDVIISRSQSKGADAQMDVGSAVVLPHQTVWITVKATTYPTRTIITAIPLRGRATVFGGTPNTP